MSQYSYPYPAHQSTFPSIKTPASWLSELLDFHQTIEVDFMFFPPSKCDWPWTLCGKMSVNGLAPYYIMASSPRKNDAKQMVCAIFLSILSEHHGIFPHIRGHRPQPRTSRQLRYCRSNRKRPCDPVWDTLDMDQKRAKLDRELDEYTAVRDEIWRQKHMQN